ncbi:tetratricopeptide repeat protein [Rubinisphaera italica]|uniref:Tetratricopeptide repeat protein n=1 Tax=Rubinisphaera italica TaxID=2527969 RepID=A0A5C5XFX8_9PLAN|nr:tetratricopeptide repeat protein [Rubinisphaera italica]TWT61724.1 Tetratricopeptide repeat protein [Rubinisphaera italica]
MTTKFIQAISKLLSSAPSQATTAIGVGTALAATGYGPLSLSVMGLGAAGIFAYDLWNGIVQGHTIDEIREHVKATLNAQQRQQAGLALGTDFIASELGLPEAELLGIDDLRRPYDILLRFVQGEIDSLEDLTKELQATQDQTLKAINQLLENDRKLEQRLNARLISLESQLPVAVKQEILPNIVKEFDRLRDLITRQAKVAPRLDLTVRVYDPTQKEQLQSVDRFIYDRQRVPLFGREQELEELHQFLQPGENFSIDVRWWLWTGPGGIGKSRLALELALQAEALGWHAGFWKDSDLNWEQWQPEQPTLIIVDYVEQKSDLIRKALEAFANGNSTSHPVRFLLLARSAEQELKAETTDDPMSKLIGFQQKDRWWEDFLSSASHTLKSSLNDMAYCDTAEESHRRLGSLSNDDLIKTIQFVHAELLEYAAEIKLLEAADQKTILDNLGSLDSHGRPLFAAFAAEAIARHGIEEVRHWNSIDLAEHCLDREINRWKDSCYNGNPNQLDAAHLNLLTLATFLGGEDLQLCDSALNKGCSIPPFEEVQIEAVKAMTGYTGSFSEETFTPLEPDLLGELWILQRLAGRIVLNGETKPKVKRETFELMKFAWCQNPKQTGEVMVNCIRDFPEHPAVDLFVGLNSKLCDNCEITRFCDAIFKRGLQYGQSNLHGNAIKEFSYLLKTNTSDDRIHILSIFFRGVSYYSLGNILCAISEYTQIIKIHNVNNDILTKSLFNRANSYIDLNMNAEAISDYERIIGIPVAPLNNRISALINHALTLHKNGLITDLEVISRYSQVIENDKISAGLVSQALFNRAVIYTTVDDLNNSIADYSTIVESNDSPSEFKVRAFYNRGHVYLLNKEYEKAINDFSKLFNFPNASSVIRVQSIIGRGLAHMRLLNYEQALKDFDQAIIYPNAPLEFQAMAKVNRGNVFGKTRDIPKSIAEYTAVIINIEIPDAIKSVAYYNRGEAYYLSGNPDSAIKDIEIALTFNTLDVQQKQEAIELLQKVQKEMQV